MERFQRGNSLGEDVRPLFNKAPSAHSPIQNLALLHFVAPVKIVTSFSNGNSSVRRGGRKTSILYQGVRKNCRKPEVYLEQKITFVNNYEKLIIQITDKHYTCMTISSENLTGRKKTNKQWGNVVSKGVHEVAFHTCKI